ncbi:MAG: RNA 2',3'-cyclic phosphodiesterase [Burkholderiales bacterium]|nr:RNA 2',3'-cyclic phosphodiesterase [Burkholderiales bacterium]
MNPARLFFAAWPPPEVQARLHAVAVSARRECGGRAVARENIHLTLVFLGEVERGRLEDIAAATAGVTGAGCDLVVDRLDYWRHNGIVWAAADSCPDALAGLVERLAAALRGAGFRPEGRRYVPHVTLLRNARRAPAASAFPALVWPVREFVLFESRPRERGRAYEVLMRWRLEW